MDVIIEQMKNLNLEWYEVNGVAFNNLHQENSAFKVCETFTISEAINK